MKQKKKWLFISLFILMLGAIGMVILYQQRAKEEAELIRHEQERMALYAYNNYEGVEKVEFTSFEYNMKTGSWSSGVRINDKYTGTFKLWGFGGEIYLNGGQAEDGTDLMLKDKKTAYTILTDVEIIFYERWSA
ncbi:hypothetical protein [Streptococcus sp. DD13]|uniref:hypothetical protein n=1 Tax=Streptococcus sp. DD13 TaxID=1777881 RepID=UPI000793E0A4|nr:hypothetical protein [Streptococcus sp. DD13]KXT78413.1 hypothetical protein STRDD13_00716 [Streptococcus sp. DD13]